MNDLQLGELLAAADPADAWTPGIDPALRELGAAISSGRLSEVRGTATRYRRRRRAAVVLGLTLTVGAGAGVAAAASGLFAHTGRQAQGGEDGTGEFIAVNAPDSPAVVERLSLGVPFPPGASEADAIQRVRASGGIMSESAIRSTVEFIAACKWTEAWLTAHDAGEFAATHAAEAILDAVPEWAALKAADGGGTIDAWRAVAKLARAGDATSIRSDSIYSGSCL